MYRAVYSLISLMAINFLVKHMYRIYREIKGGWETWQIKGDCTGLCWCCYKCTTVSISCTNRCLYTFPLNARFPIHTVHCTAMFRLLLFILSKHTTDRLQCMTDWWIIYILFSRNTEFIICITLCTCVWKIEGIVY